MRSPTSHLPFNGPAHCHAARATPPPGISACRWTLETVTTGSALTLLVAIFEGEEKGRRERKGRDEGKWVDGQGVEESRARARALATECAGLRGEGCASERNGGMIQITAAVGF